MSGFQVSQALAELVCLCSQCRCTERILLPLHNPVVCRLSMTQGVSLCLFLFVKRFAYEAVSYAGNGVEALSVQKVYVAVFVELEALEFTQYVTACLFYYLGFALDGEHSFRFFHLCLNYKLVILCLSDIYPLLQILRLLCISNRRAHPGTSSWRMLPRLE